jgi:HSP20 family protein
MVYRARRHFVPPTDVIELPDRLVIRVEIAGMRPDDFQISLLNRQLQISGFRERPASPSAAYHQVEINYGDFSVDFKLPFVAEPDAIHATYNDGFLQVEVMRRSEQRTLIPVRTGQEATLHTLEPLSGAGAGTAQHHDGGEHDSGGDSRGRHIGSEEE